MGSDQSFIFVGNRFFVLKRMLEKHLCLNEIFVVKNSFLEKELQREHIPFQLIKSKEWLISEIIKNKFDYLISNGCPYILPVSKMKNKHQSFINIHASLLPDLKGRHPVNGALLFDRDAGATCHFMDDGIDTGQIISQTRIPLSRDIDLGLLYQISFEAEGEVFEKALNAQFVPAKSPYIVDDCIYYTRKDEDFKLDFSKNIKTVVRQIKAFGIKSLGAYFIYNNQTFKVYDCEVIENEYINSRLPRYADLEIAYKYENNIVIKISERFLKLKNIEGDFEHLKVGALLGNG